MATRKFFEKAIMEKCKNPKVNSNGYFLNNSENLLDGIGVDLFQKDLMRGSGNELKSKFNAIFSSSALAVNNFSIVKKYPAKFSCFGYSNFDDVQFERQFRTGLGGTPPNLDFTIENEDVVIAIESKYLEITAKKKAKFADSYSKENLSYLNDFWFKLIKDYSDFHSYLDVAQLIKHSIGLINYKRNNPEKNIVLVYLYWIPDNYESFKNFVEHKNDLIDFENMMKKNGDLNFISTSYNEFWKSYDHPIFKEHFDKMKKRYKIEI
jgi:hypothetical protein